MARKSLGINQKKALLALLHAERWFPGKGFYEAGVRDFKPTGIPHSVNVGRVMRSLGQRGLTTIAVHQFEECWVLTEKGKQKAEELWSLW